VQPKDNPVVRTQLCDKARHIVAASYEKLIAMARDQDKQKR
jgi:hypothetical protein